MEKNYQWRINYIDSIIYTFIVLITYYLYLAILDTLDYQFKTSLKLRDCLGLFFKNANVQILSVIDNYYDK